MGRALRSDPYTHFTAAGRVASAVMDVVSRRWLRTLVTAEESVTQVEVLFTGALDDEGLWPRIEARQAGSPLDGDDPDIPILLAMSDNGPQMRAGTTREFLAMCSIVAHFGRPGTPTDQAWIETLFGHVKHEWPHLEKIRDPAALTGELEIVRADYNGRRLHARHRLRHPRRRTRRPRRADPTGPPRRPRPRRPARLPSQHQPRNPAMTPTACGLITAPNPDICSEAPHVAGLCARSVVSILPAEVAHRPLCEQAETILATRAIQGATD
jgi:transposase InsO family protein